MELSVDDFSACGPYQGTEAACRPRLLWCGFPPSALPRPLSHRRGVILAGPSTQASNVFPF
jgi:hypothetical protein